MSLWMRGVGWFGLYIAITLLPLGVAAWSAPFDGPRPLAVELSVAIAWIAFPASLCQFVLVSRLRAASRPFGTDALIQFHQQMGLVTLALAFAHPLLLARVGVGPASWLPFSGSLLAATGAVTASALVVLAATSVYRRRFRL